MRAFFRVDASVEMGTGHLSRCLTLAIALTQRGVSCHFLCRSLTEEGARSIGKCGYPVAMLSDVPEFQSTGSPYSDWLRVSEETDAQQCAAFIGDNGCEWLIVDHYALSARWEKRMRGISRHILVIDDIANRDHDCDLLLDQNLYPDMALRYAGRVQTNTRQLLGPKFALLRDEFVERRVTARHRSGAVTKILVFFGGVDNDNWTTVAIAALSSLYTKNIKVSVVVGASHPNRDGIIADCRKFGFALHIQTNAIAQLMGEADLAIGAGGTATWERCCLGLPALVFAIAENQKELIAAAARVGVVHAPDINGRSAASVAAHITFLLDSPHFLTCMSKRAMDLVDSRGVQRVLQAMSLSSVKVRTATLDDSEMLFKCRNHPEIRAVSRNKDEISRNEHEAWYLSTIDNPNRKLLVGECAEQPVGVVRYDLAGESAEVSIYLLPGTGGAGLGSELLAAAESWLRTFVPIVTTIKATVVAENVRSHRLFSSAGYLLAETCYSKRIVL